MPQLAACPACHRQLAVDGLAPGARVRCACGALAEVPTLAEAQRHLSALHCGTCGAARSDATARSCAFCGSAFSDDDLRRDLVCPGCFARIAGDARFCDHCGVAIAPLAIAERSGGLVCPACGSGCLLRGRELGQPTVRVDECARCGGLWLDSAAFDAVLARARANATSGGAMPTRTVPATSSVVSGPLYRPCPLCPQLMNRANYGGSSGVIVDSCKGHGWWFDADELSRVIAWIHAGGLERQQRRDEERAAAERRTHDPAATLALPEPTAFTPMAARPGTSAVDVVIEVLTFLFGRR